MSMVDHKHVKTVKNREEREGRAEAQVQKEKERLEKETGSGYIDMSTESVGGGVNTTKLTLAHLGRGGELDLVKPRQ